jgi:cell division septation protein DedD
MGTPVHRLLHKERGRVHLALVLFLALGSSATIALFTARQAAGAPDFGVPEFEQCANGPPPSTALNCPGGWINGILQASNSHYQEDEVVPQHAVVEFVGGSDKDRTLTIEYQTLKGGIHAYDSLARWDYTQTGLSTIPCDGIGTTGVSCSGSPSTVQIPAGNAGSLALPDADRVMHAYGATITKITFGGEALPTSGDASATITVTFNLPATPSKTSPVRVLFLWGGHIAASEGPRGWGPGLGASAISGGPYHMKVIKVDGASVGNRDNQIMGGAIATPTPTNTPTNTPTPTPTNTPTPTPTNTPTPTPTNTPTPTPTNTPTPTPTDTPTPTPTDTPTPTPTDTPTPTPTDTPTPTPTPSLEGCTPGFWKNHLADWPPTGYSPFQKVSSVFDDTSPWSDSTLLQALDFGGGPGVAGAKAILLRAAVAALLNAAHPDVDYPLTEGDVISQVNIALGSNNRQGILSLSTTLNEYNNLGCTIP